MAENDVGGIGVKFTADAAQLKQELTNLETRLRAFNEAHGQTKVRLQAGLTMPGNRAMQDFRRDIEKSFQNQGAAGPIKARIELLPPTAAQVKTLKGQIGKIEVDVIGNFKWGNKPPKTVEVEVVEKGSGTGGGRGGLAPVSATQASAQAASPQAPARRSAARRRSAVVEKTTWTQADLDLFSLDALRDQIKGTRGAERTQLQNAINQREREGRTNVGGYSAGGYKAAQPGGGGARGLTGGMTGVYGRGAPQVAHWSQGAVPYQSVLGGATIQAMGRRGQIAQPMRDIYNPYPQKGTPKPPEWRPQDLGNLTEAILARRLRSIAKRITPEAMEAGQGWYQRAGQITQGLGAGTGLGRSQIAGATATFSQNAGWSENVRNAQDFFEAFRRGARTVADVERHVATIRKDLSFNALGLEGRTQMALKAAMAETPRGVETAIGGKTGQQSPKIRAFYKALMGDPTSFTVDRHMALMMSGGTIGSTQKMHTPFQKAGQRVAGEMGMSAADLQAILWTLALGPEHAGADPYGQMRATPGMAGGARGFAAPGWLKSKPGADPRRALLDVVMDSVQPTGRPGVHIEHGTDVMGWRTDPRRSLYSVARNEEGQPLGALEMALGGRGHDVKDIMPFVRPDVRGQGIGKALYAHAQRAGFDVERASDRNAASPISRQTEEGQALWLSRKRAMGVDPDEAIRQTREREGIRVPKITFVGDIRPTGGARGFAAGGGDDDPYRRNELKEQRERMHDVSAAKANADDSRHRESVEKRDRARAAKEDARIAAMSPAERTGEMWAKSAALRESGIGEPIGPGGQLPFGFGIPATPPAGTAAGRVRATPRAGAGGHQLPLLFPSALSAPPPVAGYAPGLIGAPNQIGAVMRGRTLAPELEALHGEMGLTQLGARFGGMPQQLEEFGRPRARDVTGASRVVSNAQLAQAANFRLARPEADASNLDTPAYLRRQGEAIGQGVAHAMAAEPPPAAGETLQEHLNPPSLPPRPPTAAGAPEEPDEGLGHPSMSARALARAGLDPSGKPFSAVAGSPQARVQELLKSSREAVQLAQGTGQVRAVGTTTGGLFANLLGGKAQRELVARDLTTLRHALEDFTKEGSDAHSAFSRVTEAQTRFNQATLSGKGNVQALGKELQEAQQNAQPYVETVDAIGSQIHKLQGQISPLKQATVGFASSIAGTIVGLGIFNAVSAGLQGLGSALETPVDRLQDFRRTADRVAPSLGTLVRQQNGYAEAAVASATATAGLGYEAGKSVKPFLQQRAVVEGGNAAFKEQLDLIRAAGFFERNPNAGITQASGGLLGSPIGAQQPFFEQLLQTGSPIGGNESNPLLQGVAAGAGIGATAGAIAGTLIGPGPGTVAGGLIGGGIGAVGGLAAGGLAALFGAGGTKADFAARARSGDLSDDETKRLDDFRTTLGSLNEALKRANPELAKQATLTEYLGNQSAVANAAVEQTAKTLEEMGAHDQAVAARELRFAVTDPKTGGAIQGLSPARLREVTREALRGLTIPTREDAVAGRVRPIQAQLRLNQAQSQFERESIVPGQSFLRQLASGRAPGGAQGGVNIPNPLRAGTASLPADVLRGGLLGGQNIDTSQLTEGLGMLETQANKGRDALTGMIKAADNINRSAGIPSNLLQQFNSLTEAAGKTAATIRGISQASAWMQVNLQVKQINEQIFVMSRSLEDARSFLSGAGGGELGLLQNRARSLDIAQAELGFRQQSLALANQELGIAASTLQLQQRQRQINFQRAIAGFVTPGQTPEEIAARQKEAKLEADFAQKGQNISVTQLENQKASVELQRESLGISKEQFAVQQAMITVSAERAIGDLSRGIALLQEQARVTVQLQVNSDAVEAYQAVLEEQMASIQSVITEASNAHQTILTESAALITSYSGTIATWQSTLLTQLSNYVNGATAVFAGLGNGGSSGSTGTGGGGGGGGAGTLASGYFQSVSTPTQMIVGEAGPETIAILRNPRSMTMQPNGGGGNGVNVNIMVSGNKVGSEQDADELAATIARKVEETMSRRASLLGLRAN